MRKQLYIEIEGRDGRVKFSGKSVEIALDQKPILWSIGRVVKDMRQVGEISLKMVGATFSGTRQVIATVNTLVWVLGIKVNGKKQLTAKYDREPHITMAKAAS